VFSVQFLSPLQINAASLNWDNPNSGRNPYKFKLSDYLNSNTMMAVVGCTGVVDKISGTLADLMSGDFKSIKDRFTSMKSKAEEIKKLGTEILTAFGVSWFPKDPGPALTDIATDRTLETVNTKSERQEQLLEQIAEKEKAKAMREECLNGIAFTLAKNQLVAMTKSTMNWVNTGFDGDPMYVRNINSLVDSIERQIIDQELKMFEGLNSDTDYPYARGFAISTIKTRQASNNFADSVKQDLDNYLIDGSSSEDFENDFSKGGWNGWLALTQRPQNNPLGFNMVTSQYLANKQATEVANQKEEISQNNGFLSQKVCSVRSITKKAGEKEIARREASQAVIAAQNEVDEATYYYNQAGVDGNDIEDLQDAAETLAIARAKLEEAKAYQTSINAEETDPYEDCDEWEVVTPGSLIKDKVTTYLNSPERQLEIADTINDVLNVLFANLIDKLRLDGLSGLSSNSTDFNKVSGGFGSNSLTIDTEGYATSSGGFNTNRPFDLTKDLGNIYNHERTRELGTWNANTNTTNDEENRQLVINLGPSTYDENTGTRTYLTNVYYTVTTAGSTKLFDDGYNVWGVGDRAFWDGTTWQNWKKGMPSPITKRGVIQIQQDYIVAARELLRNLPAVMPKIGELDYCIPGPNQNWIINNSAAFEAFTNYLTDVKAVYNRGGFLKRNYVTIEAPSDNLLGQIYLNYKNIFEGTGLWDEVTRTSIYTTIDALANARSDGKWKGNQRISIANERVSGLIEGVLSLLSDFNKDYAEFVDSFYFNKIQKQYIERENTAALTLNPAWIPMAQDGLKITKNIVTYDEEIKEATTDLRDSIDEANLNIYKLEEIRKEVSKIVQAAQARREGEAGVRKEEIITKIMEENNFTRPVALSVYEECKYEEDTDYIYSEEIFIDLGGNEAGRCSDGIDNDLDGYIDADDTDCGYTNHDTDGNEPSRQCYTGSSESDFIEEGEDSDAWSTFRCESRPDKRTCLESYYLSGSTGYNCEWR
ncbi:MAG: hypothetical protein PHT84_05635, partial [Candidatus Pacebacteria bacterium]|nr:hypothetical protein [Candidatus Paceibacterota bacterium]